MSAAHQKRAQLGAQLAAAVHSFNVQGVLGCLEAGADPDFIHQGEPALCFAAAFDDGVILELLLSRGATADLPDAAGMTPLHHALDAGELANAAKLLARGASVDFQRDAGVTPTALFHAIQADISYKSTVRTAFILRCRPYMAQSFVWQGRRSTVMDVLRQRAADGDAAPAAQVLLDMVTPHFYGQQQADLALQGRQRIEALRQKPRGVFRL